MLSRTGCSNSALSTAPIRNAVPEDGFTSCRQVGVLRRSGARSTGAQAIARPRRFHDRSFLQGQGDAPNCARAGLAPQCAAALLDAVPGDRKAAARCGWQLVAKALPIVSDQQARPDAGQGDDRPKVNANMPGAVARESMNDGIVKQLAERQANQGCNLGLHDHRPQAGVDSDPGLCRKSFIMLVPSKRVQDASQVDNRAGLKGQYGPMTFGER